MTNTSIYPVTPVNVPLAITEPSTTFKKEVSGVMGSIVFFFIVYFLLLVLSIGLVIGCFYAGVAIIVNLPRLITIVAGLGLMGVGIMVFIFLIKFLFSVSRYDRSGIIEIQEADQPVLFGFIRQLTKDTATQFPKKIYVSADVNACVFYDSSFWSMFLPVKKNLQIGLGLVNSVNVSEFKAVMAHEFGHFSQRSMKLGSFVYHVNKIIYNMLFDNKGYASFLRSWANVDGVFALFASITAGIAQAIQGILKGMYGFINKKYMSLSREMEFHADAVAASVSGSDSLGSALRRIEMAASGYEIALQKCDDLFRRKKISTNIYPHQKKVLLHMAEEYKLPLRNGLPVVSDEFLKNSNFSRINFKDQWASHPSTDDRVAHLRELAVPADVVEGSAWELFENRQALQELLTKKIYEQATITEDIRTMEEKEFDEKLLRDISDNSLPAVYNGFYDGRLVVVPEDDIWSDEPLPEEVSFETVFNNENTALTKKINAIANDIEIVKAINDKRIVTKTFDFDGVKLDKSKAPGVIGELEASLKNMKTSQDLLDKQAMLLFYNSAKKKSETDASSLKKEYLDYFAFRKRTDGFLKTLTSMLEPLQEIFSGQSIPIERIRVIIDDLKNEHEPAFKKELEAWVKDGAFAKEPLVEEKAKSFINASYVYFHDRSFLEKELEHLNSITNESWSAVNAFVFDKFKSLLEKQLMYRDQ